MKRAIILSISVLLLSCNSSTAPQQVAKKDTLEKAMQMEYLSRAKQSQTFKDAWIEVQKLKINVDLAEKKSIDENRVVDEFNDAIGNTIGRVDNLSEVKLKLSKIDSTYLRMVQLNIASQLALEDAAEANAKTTN